MNDFISLIPTLLPSDDFAAKLVGFFIAANAACGLGLLALLAHNLHCDLCAHLDSKQTWGEATVVGRAKIDAHAEPLMVPAGIPCSALTLDVPDQFKITFERGGQRGDFYCPAQEFESYAIGARSNILARASLVGLGLVIGQAKFSL